MRSLAGQHLNEVAFPLGGIGTGCVSLSGRGALVDWQIFNRPNRGYRPEYAYFSLWCQEQGEAPMFRVLEGQLSPPYGQPRHGPFWRTGCGPSLYEGAGLPRLRSCRFTGEYPFARVDFRDGNVPLQISLEAFNPFIPLNDKDSSLPTVICFWHLRNPTRHPIRATIAFNLENRCGHPQVGRNRNKFVEDGRLRGLRMIAEKQPSSMALVSSWKNVTHQARWLWGVQSMNLPPQPQARFLEIFGTTGRFDDDGSTDLSPAGETWVGSLGLQVKLAPGENARLPFVLTWYFPWFEKYWGEKARWKNFYATQFADAWDTAHYVVNHLDRLESETRAYHEALFASTLPEVVLDAASSATSVLKTPTCIRLTDGTLYGWEGCYSEEGCCEGSCTHVWNFAQAVAYLFPPLERTMRDHEYRHALRDSDGHVQFRLPLPLGAPADHKFPAAADGQFGGIMRVYREWQISGDDDWLRRTWPRAKKALEYAWVAWDKDRDGLLESPHHNTLDVDFHAPEPMCGTMYLGALRAAEEIARYLGDETGEYRRVFERGSRKMDAELFNGEYYSQRISAKTAISFQYANGCLTTQLIGQWMATMLGLGDLLKPANVRKALAAIYRHNYRTNFSELLNPSWGMALNDEKGTIICSWPRGGKPKVPVMYSTLTMPGYEYQVGSHMIYEGMIEKGLTLLRAVRDRFDGYRRNPWNEFECGDYYARSMANWSYLLGLAGFSYSAPHATMRWSPKVNTRNFRCFFSVGSSWGTFQRRGRRAEIQIRAGHLVLRRLQVGRSIHEFDPPTQVDKGKPLRVTCKG